MKTTQRTSRQIILETQVGQRINGSRTWTVIDEELVESLMEQVQALAHQATSQEEGLLRQQREAADEEEIDKLKFAQNMMTGPQT